MTRLTIMLPETAENYDQALELIKRHMADKYGGFTTYDGNGGWVSPDGDVVEEPVTRIDSFAPRVSVPEVRELCERVRDLTGETAIMFAIDGDMDMVEA